MSSHTVQPVAHPARRWALIGGGSGGIGRAIATALAQDGWNLAFTYRSNRDGADETMRRVEAAGGAARAFALDLSDAHATQMLIDELATEVALAGLVYAAGPQISFAYFSELSSDEFRRVIDNDLHACFNLLRPGLRHLREHRGTVVALSTQAVARFAKRDSLSSIPKSAVEGIVKAIAVEEGRYGVTANAIGVGLLEGEGMWEFNVESGNFDQRTLDAALATTPTRRFGAPEDIADLACFLMSPKAAWITGQMINVDGGYSA
jgi:3-oxoacyl-[acyl-carrier protein] reductase